MLAHLSALLDPAKYAIGQDIPYPASVGPANPSHDPLGPSEEESIAVGLPLLAEAIRATPDVVGLCGYSLGAELVSRFLELKAAGQYQDCEIAWVALVAAPNRAAGESIDPDPVGYGINGAHWPWPADIPVWTAANPADGITSCPGGSPLRALAQAGSAFSFAELGGWTAQLAQQLIDGDYLADQYTPAQLVRAGQLIYGYVLGGAHTDAYLLDGYLERLAAIINTYTPGDSDL